LSSQFTQIVRDPAVRVYRVVVDPGWVSHDGIVNRRAFLPRAKDHVRLSTSNKGCDAQQALADWNQRFPRTSRQQVLSVSVHDCSELGIAVVNDSDAESLHVYLDFTGIADPEYCAEQLADRARTELV